MSEQHHVRVGAQTCLRSTILGVAKTQRERSLDGFRTLLKCRHGNTVVVQSAHTVCCGKIRGVVLELSYVTRTCVCVRECWCSLWVASVARTQLRTRGEKPGIRVKRDGPSVRFLGRSLHSVHRHSSDVRKLLESTFYSRICSVVLDGFRLVTSHCQGKGSSNLVSGYRGNI